MTNISIVTAFFDIGRGDWTQQVTKRGGNLPHYLERSADTYIERFSYLCELENQIIVYTSPDLVSRLEALAVGKDITVVPFDFNTFAESKDRVKAVLDDPTFPGKINPQQVRNPEYWSEDYVVVTDNKATFVADAIEKGLVKNDMVAWVDFGYCRSKDTLAGLKVWKHDFDPTKIHMFNCIELDYSNLNQQVADAVLNNIVFIHGSKVVAHKDLWPELSETMASCMEQLLDSNLVDDDQGLWLMSAFTLFDKIALHKIDYDDAFVLFREYNDQ